MLQLIETIDVLNAVTQATGVSTFADWSLFVSEASKLGFSEVILENGMSTGQWIANGLASGTVETIGSGSTALVTGSASQFAPIVESVAVDSTTGAVTTTAVGGAGAVGGVGLAQGILAGLGAGIVGLGVGDIISDEIERVNPGFWFRFYDMLETKTGITLKDNKIFTTIADGVNYISEIDLETIKNFFVEEGMFEPLIDYDEIVEGLQNYNFYTGNFAELYGKSSMSVEETKTQVVECFQDLVSHFNIVIGSNDLAIFTNDHSISGYDSRYQLYVFRNVGKMSVSNYKNGYRNTTETNDPNYSITATFENSPVVLDEYNFYYLASEPYTHSQSTAQTFSFAKSDSGLVTTNRGIMFDNLVKENEMVEGFYQQENATLPNAEESISETFPEWDAETITTSSYDPETQTTTQKKWFPLSLSNEKVVSDTQTDSQTGSITNDDLLSQMQSLVESLTQSLTNTFTPPVVPTENTGTVETPVIPQVDANTNFVSLYNPTKQQLIDFNNFLWSNNFFDNIKKIFQDPMEAIIGLHKIYASPHNAENSSSIVVGRLDSNVQSKVIDQQFIEIDCGEVSIPMKYGDVTDFEPYVEVFLFLPFINFVRLNANDVVNSIVSVKYKVDVITGNCVAFISVKKDSMNAVLYTFNGNCAETIPITASSLSGLIGTTIGAVGGAVATIATGGATLPAVIGAGMGIASGSKTNVQRGGNFSGNSGAMMQKIPYLVIKRTIPVPATNFPHFYGNPSNELVNLNEISGFTKVKEIHLENVNATENEKREIERKLQEGVIL